MNWIDIAILIVVSLSIFWGVKRGFLSTLVSLLCFVGAFYTAGFLLRKAGPYLGDNVFVHGAAFAFLFLLSLVILLFLARFIRFVGEIVISGVANLIGGVLLGLLRGMIVCVFVLFCMIMLKLDRTEPLRRSVLAPHILAPFKRLVNTPPANLKKELGRQFGDLKEAGGELIGR